MDNILIVEDEAVIRSALKRLLERNGYRVVEAESVAEACQNDLNDFSLVISDLRLPGALGTELIANAKETPVIIMTSYASMASAVDAMKLGAVDYIAKPFDHDDIIAKVRQIITDAQRNSRETLAAVDARLMLSGSVETSLETAGRGPVLGDLVGQSPAMQQLYQQILRVAPAAVTVLIQGESGTGKELAAKAIHQHSERRDKPLVCVNCAAIPESLIESELFGHEKGSFTGATAARQGLVEAAEGGTLFLDEIGELPMEAQARLLRVIQEGEVRRVGAVTARKIDVRLLAATHRNLKELIQVGKFREDLYYRLQVIELALPPLRERAGDILDIAEHLIAKHSGRLNLNRKSRLSSDAKSVMISYGWPGNIRELENAVQRALILTDGNEISAAQLGLSAADNVTLVAQADDLSAMPDEVKTAANAEKLSLEDYFQRFVQEHQHQMSETELAQKLGISRKCLWERRQRLNIPRPKKSANGPTASGE